MKLTKRFIALLIIAVTLFSIFSVTASAYPSKTLRKNSKGQEVRTLQLMLKKVVDSSIAVDGVFGTKTYNAVVKFQKNNKLDVDGIVGPKTWKALEAQYTKKLNLRVKNTASKVVTYSLSKDGSKLVLSNCPNFKVREFKCNDGSNTIKIDKKLVCLLQDIRDYFGKPVIINSAYRTSSYNAKVGGASNSQHLYGKAADIRISGVSPRQIYDFVVSLGVGGVGLYSGFVHVDVRGSLTTWTG